MLSPSEFGAGTLSEAKPLALVMPRDRYEEMFIVGEVDGEPYAVALAGDWAFTGFPCSGVTERKGLIVPNIRVEVDVATLFQVDGFYPPMGTIVRDEDQLFLTCRAGSRVGPVSRATLVSGLHRYTGRVGFWRWSVTLGESQAKRVLHSIEIPAAGA